MKVKCIACSKFSMKAHPSHAALGYGRCAAYPVATFVHIKRELPCEHYRPEPADKVELRRVWWAKKSESQPK